MPSPARVQSFRAEISHVRRIVARADWDARPTFCYRLRAALREASAHVQRGDEIDQRLRAAMRAAEHFSNSLRPNFTPAPVELMARIDEFDRAGIEMLHEQARDRARAA